MSAKEPPLPPPIDETEESCPPTMRSPTSESGMFVAADYLAERNGAVPERADEIRSSRPRAA